MLTATFANVLLGLSFLGVTSALPQEPQTHVKASNVLNYIESKQAIPWQDVETDVKLASFTADEWEKWTADALVNGNATRVEQPALTKRRDGRAIDCYRSGSWAKDSVVGDQIGTFCRSFAYGQSPGSVQTLQVGGLYNENGDAMNLVSSYRVKIAGYGSYDYCSSVLRELVYDNCQGSYQDTRGGESDSEATTFTIDPTTLNCNC